MHTHTPPALAPSPQARRTAALLASAVALALAVPTAALAQQQADVGDNFVRPDLPLEYDRGRNTGVLDRQRPEYEANGIPIGGFTLRPRLQGGFGFSDNVYQTSQKISDGYVELQPSVRLVSNWSRNEIGVESGAELTRYLHETRRNRNDWHVEANARYDLGGTTSVALAGRTEHATEPATSAAYPTAAAEPSQYQLTTARIAPAYAFGRIRMQGAYDFRTYSFDSYVTFANTLINQSNRDSTGHSGSARIEYAISPDTSVFTQGNLDHVTYAHQLLPGVANRDSQTWRVLGGLSFDIATKLRGAVALGYMRRAYTSVLYPDIGGLSAEMRVDWFVDSLTTVTLSGRRVVEDAAYPGTSGFVNNSVALRIDHELLRNLLVNVQAAYEHDAFQGIDEQVDIVRLGAGARYMLSRSLGLGLSVQHDSRATSGPLGLPTFAETRAIASIVVQH